MAVDLPFLRNNPYFAGLSEEVIGILGKLLFERTFERKTQILLEGEPADILYFIYSGAIKMYRTSPDGREQIFNIVRPGESFNDVSVFDGKPNTYSAEAMGKVHLYGIEKERLNQVIRDHYRIAMNVIVVLASRIRHLISLVEDFSFRSVIHRVARILLEYAEGNCPDRRLTQQEMAGLAGTAREVVARALKELEYKGTLKTDRHRIIITDRKALQKIAEHNLAT
jgi:CRP/FNR family transcriptional regulator